MSKKAKIHFTNEEISKKFKSSFDLVNYAIKLAKNMIETGRDSRVKMDTQNKATLILEEITQGKDQFDEIREAAPRLTGIQPIIAETFTYDGRTDKRKSRADIEE